MQTLLSRISEHQVPIEALISFIVSLDTRDLNLLIQIRNALPEPEFADTLLWMEHTFWERSQRRPIRVFEVGLEEFDVNGACSDWNAIMSDTYKVGVVLNAYYADAERHFVSTLPDDEERVEGAACEALKNSGTSINLAAQIPFAIRLHRLWRERDADGIVALLQESSTQGSLLHNERVRIAKLAIRCVQLERDASSSLFTLLARSDLHMLHSAIEEELGVSSGYEWVLQEWIERAVSALCLPETHATMIPPLLTSSTPFAHGQYISLRQHTQECLRARIVTSPTPAHVNEIRVRSLVSVEEWAMWRAFDKDVLCEFVDCALSAITSERNVSGARAPSSPLTSPGAFESSPSLLARTYHATSAIGPLISMLIDAWVDHVLPLRLRAMATSTAMTFPRPSPPEIDEVSNYAANMLNRKSGVLKFHILQQLFQAGRRHRISIHFVMLVVRDVARAGLRHPVTVLDPGENIATPAYRAFLDGDFTNEDARKAVRASLACDELHTDAATGGVSVGYSDCRTRLSLLSVITPPIDRWSLALQAWSGCHYDSIEEWFTHIVQPALSSWRNEASVVPERRPSSISLDHVLELVDAPTRVAFDELQSRIADMQSALSKSVTREEVSYAIKTNESLESADEDLHAIKAEPLLFKYFEAFCYRLNETYSGCMGKLSGQVKSNSGGHKVNFGALFNLMPDMFGIKAGVAIVLAPAVIAMRMRSAGQASDFVRLASDPEEFALVVRAAAIRILNDDRKRRQLRYAIAKDEEQNATIRSLRASVRRMQRVRYESTVSRFAVHDAQVLIDAVMDGDLSMDSVERLRRTGDIAPLADALSGIVIQRTVTNMEEQDGCNEGSKLSVVFQAAAGAAKPYAAAAPRALAAVVSKIL